MASTEVLLLTGAVIVADVIALHEYLRLEDKLARIKAEKALVQPTKLSELATEVNEPVPQPALVAMSSDEKDRLALEQENLQLKAKADALEKSRADLHRSALDKISNKIDDILTSVSSMKEKVTGESTVVSG